MKVKRLTREGWGFQGFPYHQVRIDNDYFHGMACMIEILSGDYNYWEMPKAGKTPVCGAGMIWLQLVPDNTNRIVTAMFKPQKRVLRGEKYPYTVSVWYVDVSAGTEPDTDGVLKYTDLYLDVIFSPQGDISISDRDELEEALKTGDITEEQYRMAIKEGLVIVEQMCGNYEKTEVWCEKLLQQVMNEIKKEKE